MSDTLITAIGISSIFIMTALGSSLVFLFKNEISPKVNTLFLGFASGIMIAASVWSLLIPAMAGAETSFGKFSFVPAAIGFLVGGGFMVLLDKFIPHIHSGTNESEGPKSQLRKSFKMFFAVLLHNIPEGLAVGFAFGAAANGDSGATVMAALGLAIGISVQNFPEGAAVALPMRNAVGSRKKAFLYGAGTGVVEPIFALIGYFLAAQLTALQPWLLAFAAGAMVFIVAEDLIPDAKLAENPHMGTWGVMAGFVVMMILDVALG